MKKRRKYRQRNSYKTAIFGTFILCLSIVVNTENDISNFIHTKLESSIKNIDVYEQTAIKVGMFFSENNTDFKSPLKDAIITSSFGERINPVTNVVSHHNGTDLDSIESTLVTSIADGQISKIDYDQINGNYILISHKNGYQSIYAHLDEIFITSGEVKQGEVIATIGNTGQSTGTHLHLEILKNNEHIDPKTVINFNEN